MIGRAPKRSKSHYNHYYLHEQEVEWKRFWTLFISSSSKEASFYLRAFYSRMYQLPVTAASCRERRGFLLLSWSCSNNLDERAHLKPHWRQDTVTYRQRYLRNWSSRGHKGSYYEHKASFHYYEGKGAWLQKSSLLPSLKLNNSRKVG